MGQRGRVAGVTADVRQRVVLLAAVAVGVVLRIDATIGTTTNPDAANYVRKAGELSWLDPWRASYREPLWEMFVKVTTGLFGYRVGALQVVVCVVGIAALLACVWALRSVGATGWVLVAGTAAIAFSERLIDTGGEGTRETTAVLVAAFAVIVVARAPRLVPILGAVMLGVRWEMGLALLAISVALAFGRVLELRRLLAGLAVAAVLVGPFLVNNAREHGDPMFHSNVHATFYANMERTRGVTIEGTLPPNERLTPDLGSAMYSGPLVSWGEYVTDVVGVGSMVEREADAVAELPVDALRLGRLPWSAGVALFAVAVTVAVRRRDRVVLVLAGLSASAVIGYGMTLPWFDRRLVSHLTVLLVLLLCAGMSATPPPEGDRDEAQAVAGAR